VQSICGCRNTMSKIINPQVRNFLLNYTQTDPQD
jgi:hypothetical protein